MKNLCPKNKYTYKTCFKSNNLNNFPSEEKVTVAPPNNRIGQKRQLVQYLGFGVKELPLDRFEVAAIANIARKAKSFILFCL